MPERGRFTPFPEPDPPDFARLPAGTEQAFLDRLARFPVGRVRTRIGAQAVLSNEGRALHRFERDHGLDWDRFAPLGTWPMRAAHDRISAARPDLLPPRRPAGSYSGLRRTTGADRLRARLVRLGVWNLLTGTGTWIRNRAIGVRAATLRWQGLQ